MSLILGANSVTGGYEVDNSLRFDDGSSDSLTRTPSSNGDQKIWTFSGWVKRGNLSSYQYLLSAYYGGSDRYTTINFEDDDKLLIYGGVYTTGASTTVSFNKKTSQVFRDVSAWYHIVVAVDTTQATASDRIKIYVNGSQITSFDTNTNPSQNDDTFFNVTTTGNQVGAVNSGSYYDGYMSECVFIDGQQLDPTSFGEFDEDTGIWKPIAISGLTYGTNGFFLEFKDSSALGDDTSGNTNDFTVNNLTSIDQTTDTPTNNFATMNPLGKSGAGTTGSPTFSNGNLTVAMSEDTFAYSTLGVAQGKWYFEFTQSENTADNDGYPIVGFNTTGIGAAGDTIGFRTPSGSDYRGQIGTSSISNAFLSARVANDVFGFYLDLDNSTLIIHKNGSTYMNTGYTSGLDWSAGLTTTNTQTGFYFPYIQSNSANAFTDSFNFGNAPYTISSGNADANDHGNFEYSPTLGAVNYFALCTKNLAEFG
jgi:hypothetical protein